MEGKYMKGQTIKRMLTLAVAMTTAFGAYSIMPLETHAETATEPVYRMYNPNTGEHLYTTDANERNVLYATQGWGYEGIGWYAAKGTGKPVYRLYNPQLGNHLYTTDTHEISVITSEQGWVADFDGQPLFYSDGTVPVYRVYNQSLNGMHHLTTDKHEYDVLPEQGWQQEGYKISAVSLGKPITTTYASTPAPAPSPAPTPSQPTVDPSDPGGWGYNGGSGGGQTDVPLEPNESTASEDANTPGENIDITD